MDYPTLKLIHMTCALVSYALFFVRGIWRFSDSPMLQRTWVRVVPHVNDTVLLLAAIGLTMTVAAYPGMHAFLAAKLLGLLIYIGLGLVALRFARTRRAQITAWLLAQVTFFYIVAVALSKTPFPGLR